MSKYGIGVKTTVAQCKLELEELNKILDKYQVSEEDREELNSMVKEPYYQWSEANKTGRVLERMLEENNIKIDMNRYIELSSEEEKKFPFNLD